MNKELPLKVRSIFSDLDPIIWNGIWLEILNKLLLSPEMPKIWQILIEEAQKNKNDFPLLNDSQFIKWELKAFVAQAVRQASDKSSKSDFIDNFEKFFNCKNYVVSKNEISKIYEIINN